MLPIHIGRRTPQVFGRFLDRARNGGVATNIAILSIGTALSQGFLVVTSPVVTRIYSPSDFGIWSLFTSVALTLAVVANWRYELAVVLPEQDQDAIDVLVMSLAISGLMSALLLVAVICFRSALAELLGAPDMAPWLWFTPLCLLLAGLYQPINYWCTRKRQFSLLAISQVAQSMTVVGMQIVVGWLAGGSAGTLILSTVLGQVVVVAVVGISFWPYRDRVHPHDLRRTLTKNLIRFRNFPLYTAPYSFVAQFSRRALFVLLGMYATTSVVGLFALAMKLTLLPVQLVASALNQVFFQKAAAGLRSAELEEFVVKALTMLAVTIAPAMVFFLFNAHWMFGLLFGMVFGTEWANASDFVLFLMFPSFALLFMAWLDRLYDVLGRQRLALWLEVGYDAVSLGVFALALSTLHSAEWAVAVYSTITTIYYLIWVVITFRIARFSLMALGRIGLLFLLVFVFAGAVHWLMEVLLQEIAAGGLYLAGMAIGYAWFAHRALQQRASRSGRASN